MTVRRIAVYGKGGIGKSTISSNLTASLSEKGKRVMQIGCDPKHDSTRLLTSEKEQRTVLEYLRNTKEDERKLEDIAEFGYKGCICVEAGGPEPGIGCAGRGIISAFELLDDLGMNDVELDIVLYDVLGDVVCGGFAVPLRNNYADIVYVVTSGEFMSIYAANNILRGTANYNPDRIGGIIFNSRGDDEEIERVKRFSDAVGIPIIAEFARSKMFLEAEQLGKTVVEAFPDSDIAKKFSSLAEKVVEGKRYTAKFLSEAELENVVLERSVMKKAATKKDVFVKKQAPAKRYMSRNVHRNETLHGCAFTGASVVSLSIKGMATVMHSPRSCAHYSIQIPANSVRRTYHDGKEPVAMFVSPNVRCSDMNDRDMIFGSIASLERNMRDAIEEGNDVIALITSCPSGVIGEDIDGMIDRIKKDRPSVTIIPLIEDGNINGDFMQGVIDASLGLMRSLSKKGRKERSVNVVGVKTLATNTTTNLAFVNSVLKRMDVKVNCNCVGDASVDEIRNIPNVELSVLITPDRFALMVRDFMKDEFGSAFAKNYIRPGMVETELWIREIGKHFREEEKAEDIIREFRNEFEERLNSLKEDLKGRTAYIVGTHMDVCWIMETAIGAGVDVMRCVVVDILDHSKDYDLDVRYPVESVPIEKINEIADDVRDRRPDLLISSYPMDVNEGTETCFIPLVPDVGPMAGPIFAGTWKRMLKAPRTEGWRKDVI